MIMTRNWLMQGIFLLLIFLSFAMNCTAMEPPQSVTLDVLTRYYEPVVFDHQMHVEIAEDCSRCHHHTTGTGTTDPYCAKCHAQPKEMMTVSCSSCHSVESFSAAAIRREGQADLFHIDKPGLVGAYHLNCLGCHQEMDGPTGCLDCHKRTLAGDKFYHSGRFAPKSSGHKVNH